MKRPFALNLRHVTVSLFVAATLHGAGCNVELDSSAVDAVDLDDERIASAEQYAGGGGDPGTHNHFRPRCFWDHSFQQTARDLANTTLINRDGILQKMPYMSSLVDPTCRQEALEVLIGCAVGPGKQIVDKDDGRVYEGELDFAGAWVDRPLNTEERERLTGCMIERLNAFGFTMSIYVFSYPDFPADANGLQLYTVTESQAWGNLFDSLVMLNPTHAPNGGNRPPFDAYVCQEPGLYNCTVAGDLYTAGRICDNGDPACGLILMGPCDNNCPHNNPDLCTTWKGRTFARTPDDKFCDPIRH